MKTHPRPVFAMLFVLSLAWSVPMLAQTYYVSTTGNDSNSGTSLSAAFASLARAQAAAEISCTTTRTQTVTINISQGTYYLLYSQTNPGTLVFTCKDSGASSHGVNWQPNSSNTEPVVVSGAVQVGGTSGTNGLGLTWTATAGYTNVYQVTLPTTFNNNNPSTPLTYTLQPFEYLYYQPASSSTPTRRLRARIEQEDGVGYYMSAANTCTQTQSPGGTVSTSLCNLGTYLRVYNPVPYSGGVPNCPNDGVKCLDRFYYSSGNATGSTSLPDPIMDWSNLDGAYTGSTSGTGFSGPCKKSTGSQANYPEGDIGITMINAWTIDAMRIACIDTSDEIIYLTGATKANPGLTNSFGPNAGHRYYIENARDAFWEAQANGQTGLWYWDRSTSILYYIVNSGETLTGSSPDTVLIPQLPYSSVIASGQQLSNQFPQTANPGDFVGGSLLWAQAPTGTASGLSYVEFNGITFQMDDFVPSSTGFNNDDNGDVAVPQAIDCESCQHVVFNNITVAYTSGSGLLIASPPGNTTTTAAATTDTIESSSFLDIGDSGIRIGHDINLTNDTTTSVVNGITVSQNLVDGYSRVFADGEGIAEANGQGNTIGHNDVTDGYHAGISICHESCGPFSTAGAGVSGSNITTTLNRVWNLNQGTTSDGGSIYYNVGGVVGSGTGQTSGSGSGDIISGNIVHDNTDSQVIDGYHPAIPGTGYGGDGIYLDSQTAGVTVKYNVVYNMSDFAVSITEGPVATYASNPNLFENNIFALAYQGMFFEQTPWEAGSCPSTTPFTTVQLLWNIWDFDQPTGTPVATGNTTGFSAVQGCANSCGQPYYQFQDFEANAWYRANTGTTGYPTWCNDANAYHVLSSPASNGQCANSNVNTGNSTFMPFDATPPAASWQQGTSPATPVTMDEDDGVGGNTTDKGTCSWNPMFGTTGAPSDYHIAGTNAPPTPFIINDTNTTITTAGRTGQPVPTVIPETLPTYHFTSF